MAGYIAKQLVAKPLDAVKNVAKDAGSLTASNEEDLEATMIAAEEKRRERFEGLEEQRENMRQTIRDKYGLKKKSDFLEVGTPEGSRRSSTHRCSDVNLNTHRRSAQDDSFIKFIPTAIQDAASRVVELPQQLANQATDKCCLM
ncbi:putative complexin-1 isoform 1 [Schistosoma japonicum]|uniref:Putative complexin-1 isoform 1 n=1 Tax=Schistosoma japonicum TaxID=6182 RepID=C1LDU5_SCHJA|nr:putative complexin-1 isoform 1 [Schistosoma japonicum]CAX72873.1 hypothetical protein [Schistosoma japonicum]